jgi:hypothetical protein
MNAIAGPLQTLDLHEGEVFGVDLLACAEQFDVEDRDARFTA